MNKSNILIFFTLILSVLVLPGVIGAGDISINPGNTNLGAGDAGNNLTGVFTVVNSGSDNLSVDLSAINVDDGAGHVYSGVVFNPSSQITLKASESKQVTYIINIPSNQYAATYSGSIEAVHNSTNKDSFTFSFSVNPNYSLSSGDISFNVGKGLSNGGSMAVTNTGNAPVNVNINIADLSDGSNIISGSKININPSSFALNVGESKSVKLSLTAGSSQPNGNYAGNININYEGNIVQKTLTVTVRDPIHSVTFDDAEIGDENTKRGTTQRGVITINNDGDYTESVTLDVSNFNSRYKPVLSESSFSIAPGVSKTVNLDVDAADDADSGRNEIGDIILSYGNHSITKKVYLTVRNMIEIKDLDVDVGSGSDNNLGNGDRISKKASPGDKVVFNFDIDNLYSNNDDIDMRDVSIEVTIRNIDDNDDLIEESDVKDIRADDSESFDVRFNIPKKVDSGNYDVDIVVTGDDQNGGRHKIEWSLELEVEKKRDDIQIVEASLGSSSLKCFRSTDVRTKIANLGRNNQDKVRLRIRNDKLGINYDENNIFLDENYRRDDNEYTKVLQLNLDNAAPGNYKLIVETFYEDNTPADFRELNLNIGKCETSTAAAESSSGEIVVKTDSGSNENSLSGSANPDSSLPAGSSNDNSDATARSIEVPFTETPYFIGLLIILNLLVVAAVVLLALNLAR